MTPAVSVVVPTCNRAASLRRLLDALAGQQAPAGGFEVVVVDDGSSDDTPAVAGGYDFVRYVRQANAGPAAARNRGWRAAAAPVVAFTDDDTVPDRRWLTELLAAFDGRPDLAAVGGRIVALERSFLDDFVQLEGQVDHSLDGDGCVRYLVTANSAWRTSALSRLGGFDESFPIPSGEDTDLSFRALAAGQHLEVVAGAQVAHDHRARLAGILRTAARHARARPLLIRRHPERPWGQRSRSTATPSDWRRRYRRYREAGCGRARAALYLGLRLAVLATYGGSLVMARRADARARAQASSQAP